MMTSFVLGEKNQSRRKRLLLDMGRDLREDPTVEHE